MPHPLSRLAHNVVFWTLLFVALSFLGINFLFSSIENYKTDLAIKLSSTINAPVKIGKLEAKLHGIHPHLQLSELSIADEKIQLKEIRLGINVWQLFSEQKFLNATTVTLVGAQITLIRHTDGSIALEGLQASDGQPTWLLNGNYILLQSVVTWRDEKLNKPDKQISSVNLAMLNEGKKHRLNLLAQLQHNEPLRVSLDFSGNPFDLQTINGKIFLESNNFKLKELTALDLPLSLKITDGVSNLKAWANVENGKLKAIRGEAKLQNLLLTRPQRANFKLDAFSTHFHLKQQQENWQISLPDFEFSAPETYLNGAVLANWNVTNSVENSVGLFLEKIDLQPLIPIANFFTDSQTQLNQFGGTIKNLRAFVEPKKQKFALNSAFEDLKISVADLNISHLNGQLQGNEQHGSLQLNSEKLVFHAPTLFREVLPEIEFKTTLNWLQTPESWQIFSEKIVLNNRDIPSESALKLALPKNGDGFMDLQTDFEIRDATQTWRYLPVGIMEKDVVEWLDKAFEKGQVKNGKFLFYGKLKDFPFEKNNGVFEVVFDAENARLNYAPDWLPLDNLTAQVRFYQDSLQVNLSGMAENAKLKTAEVKIPSMFTSDFVEIIGEAEGEISQVLSFMQRTPLKSRVDSVLTAIAPQGKTNVALDLKISITDNIDSKIKGSAKFQNAKLKVKSLDLPVQNITGALQFTENGVFSDRIDALALNRPIQVRLQSSNTQTAVNVIGSTSVEDLFSQLEILPLTQLDSKTTWIEGLTDYNLTLTLPYAKTAPTIQIQSMLAGVVLNLPAELAKPKLQKIPFSMTLTLGDETFLPLTLNYNERLKAAVNLDTKNKKVQRGAILLGDGKIELPEELGLSLKISRDGLALQDWLGLAMAGSENNADSIHTVSIQSRNALWKNTELGAFDLLLKRENTGWRGDLKSNFATGKIILENNSSLKLALEKFDLAVFKKFQNSASGNPQQPAFSRAEQNRGLTLSLQSLQTFWNDKPLGKLSIETRQTENGMLFKTIDLQATTHHLSMTGESNLQTKLQGTLEFFKAGLLFSNLGITKDIAETSGSAKLNLNWQGSPQQFELEKLRGDIELNLQNGRILSIEPGFGRVLGMLALEQWLKRIQFDFSDVYSEGLTFNSIDGNFALSQGKASTQDLTVDAIPAKIVLKGDTDYVRETVDYLVDVTPKSADAVPIAGTIVSKVMSLVGKTLTGKNQDGFFFGSQYQVTGSWGNVAVIATHENDGLIQKTWRGITQFPWLPEKFNSKEAQHD
jgi:uncharacterized protein (TIGR02099 family)